MSPEQKIAVFEIAARLTQTYCEATGQGQAGQALQAHVDPNFGDAGETNVAIWVWEAFKIFNMGLQKALWDRTFEATGSQPAPKGPPAAPPTAPSAPAAPATPTPATGGGVPTTTPAGTVAQAAGAALANLAQHMGI